MLLNSYVKIVGPVYYPSNKTPGPYTVGKVFQLPANGAIIGDPQDCPIPTPTPDEPNPL